MLQWMGGSRRKVTNSRKSMQKRQKQYFEQRRRQQQQSFDGGNFFEGNQISSQHNENNRSLDIISLLNLSTVAPEQTSSSPSERDKSEVDALNHQTTQHPPVAKAHIKHPETSEIKEDKALSRNQVGTAYPEMISVSSPYQHTKAFNAHDDKMNQLKFPSEHSELSVIDILGDDEPNSTSTKYLGREAHAAFTIEGLGKVEPETPVHSPKANSRNFLRDHSSPLKAPKPAHCFKKYDCGLANPECELDAMMWDIDVPLHSSVEDSFYSEDTIDLFGNAKKKSIVFGECSLFNDHANNLCDFVGNDELIYRNKWRSTDIWNDSSIRTGSFIDESGYGISERHWMDQIDDSGDMFNPMDYGKKHFTFGGVGSQENRFRTTMRKASKHDLKDSPAPNLKYQKKGNLCNFMFPDTIWNCPPGRCHNVLDLTEATMDSWFIGSTEDTKDSLSLPSEESFSTTSVRNTTKTTTANLKENQTIRSGNDISELAKAFRQRNNWNPPLQGESIRGLGKFTSLSRPSRSGPLTTALEMLKPDNSKLFDEGYDTGETSSGGNSCCETSGGIKHLPSSCRVWMDDIFGSSTHPRSHNSRLISKSMLDSSQDSTVGSKHNKPFQVHGSLKPEKVSLVGAADEKSDFQVNDHRKSESQREILDHTGSLSSEDRCQTEAFDSEVSSNRKEFGMATVGESVKAGESVKETPCLQHVEEELSCMVNANIFKGKPCKDDRKCQEEGHISHLCQTGFGGKPEMDDSGFKGRVKSNKQTVAGSTSQELKLDSCVLQLLCVQVLMEASAKVTGEKAVKSPC